MRKNMTLRFEFSGEILRKLALLVAVLLPLSLPAQVQADYYVRAGAGGASNGTDWNNAYTSLPATLIRGETYWIADGNYGSYTFDDAVSGGNYIRIRKATISDHGTNTGWVSSYGDGQAIFTNISISTNYWIIDGNSPSSYGISINPTTASSGVRAQSGVDYLTIRSVSVDGTSAAANTRSFQGINNSNLTIENCEFKSTENDGMSIETLTNSTISNVYIHSRRFGGGIHGDAIEIFGGGNNTVKNSRIDWDGQQIFWGGGSTHGIWHIYGNRFYGGTASGKGLHPHSTNPTVGPIYVYNNSFIDLAVGMDLGSNTTGYVKNNIYINIGGDISFGGTSHTNNYFKSGMSTSGDSNAQVGSDPFVSSSIKNFNLSFPTNSGDSSIGTMYQTDPAGKIRGADGVWDRGAFEFTGAGEGTKIPNPPGIIPF